MIYVMLNLGDPLDTLLEKGNLPSIFVEYVEYLIIGTTDNEIPAMLSINARTSNFEIDFLSASSVKIAALRM